MYIRAFFGLCSYYRRFVKSFSHIAKPLHQLTEEKRKFIWDEQCETAFRDLKQKLCGTPILGYPWFIQCWSTLGHYGIAGKACINQEATTVAEKLVTEVFCIFGDPLEIHSDQGRNFESQVF